jgi:putative transposase
MKKKKHTPEQIINKLRESDVGLANGATVEQVCKQLTVSEQTYYRWRNQFGGMKADDMKRLKELERENQRLKNIVADQAPCRFHIRIDISISGISLRVSRYASYFRQWYMG